jgi:elongation factor Ts
MSTIAASAVKDLREQTNCPMIDCKKALVDAGGDFDAAKNLLRERLGNLDVTKTDSGTEGLIAGWLSPFFRDNESIYTLIEVGTETDFAAKNPEIIEISNTIARISTTHPEQAEVLLAKLRAITGENIVLRRKESHNDGRSKCGFLYIHHDRKKAAVVLFSAFIEEEIAKNVAMHIVATTPSPACIKTEDVPADKVEAERVFLQDKAKASGKPGVIQNKIVEGGLSKFRSSLSLLEQPFVKYPSKKIKDILPKDVEITHFARWEI